MTRYHGAAAAVHAHRDAHFYCGTRVDFGRIRERLKASRLSRVSRQVARLSCAARLQLLDELDHPGRAVIAGRHPRGP